MNFVTTTCALGRIQKCDKGDKGGERVTHFGAVCYCYVATCAIRQLAPRASR
jgi:hypothetical protein